MKIFELRDRLEKEVHIRSDAARNENGNPSYNGFRYYKLREAEGQSEEAQTQLEASEKTVNSVKKLQLSWKPSI